MEAEDEGWALLLRHLGNTGPSLAEDVQRELQLTPKELKAIRTPLERCGAIVSRLVPLPAKENDWITELVRWDHLRPDPLATGQTPHGGLDELVVAGVRAAVVCPERDPKRWFSWTWLWQDGLIDRLVDEQRLTRPEPGLPGAPVSSGVRDVAPGLWIWSVDTRRARARSRRVRTPLDLPRLVALEDLRRTAGRRLASGAGGRRRPPGCRDARARRGDSSRDSARSSGGTSGRSTRGSPREDRGEGGAPPARAVSAHATGTSCAGDRGRSRCPRDRSADPARRPAGSCRPGSTGPPRPRRRAQRRTPPAAEPSTPASSTRRPGAPPAAPCAPRAPMPARSCRPRPNRGSPPAPRA